MSWRVGFFVFVIATITLADTVQWWVTSLDESILLQRQQDQMSKNGTSSSSIQLKVADTDLKQNIYGYGAALTQSSAFVLNNYKQSNATNYWNLLNSLFSSAANSAKMNIIRIPITASDFVPGGYWTLDDVTGDYSLNSVSFDNDPYTNLILQDILTIHPTLKVIVCPWTAPTWLKTSAGAGNAYYWGSLSDFDTYANYLVKVVQLYKSIGVDLFGLSLQNEPLNEPNDYPVMRMSAQDQAKLVQILGPRLQNAGFGGVKIMIYDHNWDQPDYPMAVLANSTAYPWVGATAFHCYAGDVSAQSQVYAAYPDKEIYFTECSGTGPSNFSPNIQWNTNNLFIGATSNWASMVLYWNIALYEDYGPSNGGCSNCRPVVSIAKNNSWIKYNEEFYGLAQFGKFVSAAGSSRLGVTMQGWGCMNGTAFKNSDNSVVAIVSNFCATPQQTIIARTNDYIEVNVPVGLSTFYWEVADGSSSTTGVQGPGVTSSGMSDSTTGTTGPGGATPESATSVAARLINYDFFAILAFVFVQFVR